MAWRTPEEKRVYQRAWARQYRLMLLQARYAMGDRSRAVINGLGRAALHPGEKWCAWGQHAVPQTGFRVSQRNSDGRQDMCRECQDMAVRVSVYKAQVMA